MKNGITIIGSKTVQSWINKGEEKQMVSSLTELEVMQIKHQIEIFKVLNGKILTCDRSVVLNFKCL